MIYFDSASTSYYKPDIVKQTVAEALSQFGNGGRGGHCAAMSATRAIYNARASLAPLFGARPKQ
ncbi:MAG: aminotransferase class V-fold PLP-dependent enzyme, partial [Clostridiales bacterium]|nr:aminotransferase class V-fold PLP-dependent enzyme [Clostridiales bacterium]